MPRPGLVRFGAGVWRRLRVLLGRRGAGVTHEGAMAVVVRRVVRRRARWGARARRGAARRRAAKRPAAAVCRDSASRPRGTWRWRVWRPRPSRAAPRETAAAPVGARRAIARLTAAAARACRRAAHTRAHWRQPRRQRRRQVGSSAAQAAQLQQAARQGLDVSLRLLREARRRSRFSARHRGARLLVTMKSVSEESARARAEGLRAYALAIFLWHGADARNGRPNLRAL